MKIKKAIETVRIRGRATGTAFKGLAREVSRRMEAGGKEKNRTLLLFISMVLILDYFMFSYHTGKNVFDFFPSIPVISDKEKRAVYLPGLDGKSLIKEIRKLSIPKDNEMFVRMLFKVVIKGSIFENTSTAVPIQTHIRKIWFHEGTCYIDCALPVFKEKSNTIEGSEQNFLNALRKTITENIPSIKSVEVLEKGVPGRRLWEIAVH